jgi:hypothetical protein
LARFSSADFGSGTFHAPACPFLRISPTTGSVLQRVRLV